MVTTTVIAVIRAETYYLPPPARRPEDWSHVAPAERVWRWAERRQQRRLVPPAGFILGQQAYARINHNRWVADCACGSAQVVTPTDPRMACTECGLGWIRLSFPEDVAAAEASVASELPHERNWWNDDDPAWDRPPPSADPVLDGMITETAAAAGLLPGTPRSSLARDRGGLEVTFAPRTWVVGEVVTAALLNQEIRDQWNTVLGAWTSYTPAWTAATTNPVLGNGTSLGRYMKVGRTVLAALTLTTGSTTTYGSGAYSFSMPAAAAASGVDSIGGSRLTAGSTYIGQLLLASGGSTVNATFPTSATPANASNMNPTAPATLAAGHILRGSIAYEAAA